MKSLTIGGKEYKIEYSFEAAEYKDCVDKAFKIVSGGYMAKRGTFDDNDRNAAMSAFIDGTSDMVSDLPTIVPTFLYAGLLENNPVSDETEAKALFRQFIKENTDDEKADYYGMFMFLRDCMVDDGFFKLTGLERLVEEMNREGTDLEKNQSKSEKIPQDHKKKSTSTK